MKASEWVCINGHRHVARWTGDAYVMARTCPVCSTPALASEATAFIVPGVLLITQERKARAKSSQNVSKYLGNNDLRNRKHRLAKGCAKSFYIGRRYGNRRETA